MIHINSVLPHGGQLIDRIAPSNKREEFLSQKDNLPRLRLEERTISDLIMIAIGGFSPLKGFMEQADYHSVVQNMHLSNGVPWSIPITLPVQEEVANSLKEGELIRLDNLAGEFIGVLELTQKYKYQKNEEAIKVYKTEDEKHPGVQVLYKQGKINLAGPIWLLKRSENKLFPKYQIDPRESRKLFQEKKMVYYRRISNT